MYEQGKVRTADIRKEGVIMREQLTKSDVEKIQEEIEYRKLVVRKNAIEAVKPERTVI